MLDSTEFDTTTAQLAAIELRKVLAARTHRKKIMGEIHVIPGTLGEAIRLPQIIHQLESRSTTQRNRGLENFRVLWQTLSEPTRREIEEFLGWYEPHELDWDDPRSNRRPKLPRD